jgi:hypothetical protein
MTTGTRTDQDLPRQSTNKEASEATSIVVINDAANSLGCPSAKAIHPATDRHANAATRTIVLAQAAVLAQEKPFSMSTPQTAESPPKAPPEISAVFAPAGLDKYPTTPQKIRKIPNPTNQRPQKFIATLSKSSQIRTSRITMLAKGPSALRSGSITMIGTIFEPFYYSIFNSGQIGLCRFSYSCSAQAFTDITKALRIFIVFGAWRQSGVVPVTAASRVIKLHAAPSR